MYNLISFSVTIYVLCNVSGVHSEEVVVYSKNMFNDMNLGNFDRITKDKDVMLLFFYMPWCGHSKALQPEWEKASQRLEQNKEYILGRVNCEGSGKTLCEKFKIAMYPDIRLFRHGKFQESYEGDRTADAILDYLQRAQATQGPVTSAQVPSSPPVEVMNTLPPTPNTAFSNPAYPTPVPPERQQFAQQALPLHPAQLQAQPPPPQQFAPNPQVAAVSNPNPPPAPAPPSPVPLDHHQVIQAFKQLMEHSQLAAFPPKTFIQQHQQQQQQKLNALINAKVPVLNKAAAAVYPFTVPAGQNTAGLTEFSEQNVAQQQYNQAAAFTYPANAQNTQVGMPGVTEFGASRQLGAKKKASSPTLMEIYESIYHPKNMPVYKKTGQVADDFNMQKEGTILNYVINRHAQLKQTPEFHSMPYVGSERVKQYYDWKYQQNGLSNAEKQHRVELGSFLLDPAQKRARGRRTRIQHHKHTRIGHHKHGKLAKQKEDTGKTRVHRLKRHRAH